MIIDNYIIAHYRQAVYGEDSTSHQSYTDPGDAKDVDFEPASSSTSLDAPKVTVSTYLDCNLDGMAGEIARAHTGKETQARLLNSFCAALYKHGKLDQRFVVPRSKIQVRKHNQAGWREENR